MALNNAVFTCRGLTKDIRKSYMVGGTKKGCRAPAMASHMSYQSTWVWHCLIGNFCHVKNCPCCCLHTKAVPHGWLGFTTLQVGSGGLLQVCCQEHSPLLSFMLYGTMERKSANDWQGEMRRRQASDKIKKDLSLEKRAVVDVLWAVRSFSSLKYTKLGWKPPGRVPWKEWCCPWQLTALLPLRHWGLWLHCSSPKLHSSLDWQQPD